MIVIDACIISKMYLQEPDALQARRLIEQSSDIIVPALVRMEVASAITRRVRVGEIDEASARLACARWKKHVAEHWFKLIPNEEAMDAAMALSIKLKHPLADCLYLAVAQKFKVPLITADHVFHQRCHTHYKKLHLLADC